MSTIIQSNEAVLQEHADELAVLRQKLGDAAAIAYANRLIDRLTCKLQCKESSGRTICRSQGTFPEREAAWPLQRR
jgi:hypothetical protein